MRVSPDGVFTIDRFLADEGFTTTSAPIVRQVLLHQLTEIDRRVRVLLAYAGGKPAA